MSTFFKGSWKTTSAGVTMIAAALVHIWFIRKTLTEEQVMLAVGGVIGGLGLLFSRDNDKSSEDVGADSGSKLVKQMNAVANPPPKA